MKMLLPALAVLSSTAMAADMKWNLEGRFDYVVSTTKHEISTAGQSYDDKRAEFYSNVLRLNSVFTINDNLSGRFRYRFSTAQGDKAGTRSDNRDLSFQNVDFFYVDHKNEWFTTRIGKHNQVESLGREYFMSGTDYPVTMINPTSSTIAYTALNSAVYTAVKNDADIYHVGASAIYSGLKGHTFTLSLFNPNKNPSYDGTGTGIGDKAASGDSAKNTKVAWGAYYNGNFMDGLLQPTLGYTSFGQPGQSGATTSPDATHKLMAVGVRSVVAGFTVDADWKQYKKENTVANATSTTTTADKTTSYWANVAYTWNNLTPFITYIHDKYEADKTSTVDYKRDAYSAGLQIKPFKENNFRYHLAWTNDVKKNDSGTETKTKATLWTAGIKFDL